MDGQQHDLPAFLRIPPELRLLVYAYLLDDHGKERLQIRHKPLPETNFPQNNPLCENLRRSKYYIAKRPLRRFHSQTTYTLAPDDTQNSCMHTSIMAANRQIYQETSYMLYGRHSFNFDADLEAVVPFLSDLTPAASSLIQEISIKKEFSVYGVHSDRLEWAYMCHHLSGLANLKKLRITIEGGRPPAEKGGAVNGGQPDEEGEEGQQQQQQQGHEHQDSHESPLQRGMKVSDFALLCYMEHDSMSWVTKLQNFQGLETLEIVPSLRYMAKPKSSEALLYAAFSASLGSTFVDFLRDHFNLPAVVPGREIPIATED